MLRPVVGISHQSASVEVRERVALAPEQVVEVSERLRGVASDHT